MALHPSFEFDVAMLHDLAWVHAHRAAACARRGMQQLACQAESYRGIPAWHDQSQRQDIGASRISARSPFGCQHRNGSIRLHRALKPDHRIMVFWGKTDRVQQEMAIRSEEH